MVEKRYSNAILLLYLIRNARPAKKYEFASSQDWLIAHIDGFAVKGPKKALVLAGQCLN